MQLVKKDFNEDVFLKLNEFSRTTVASKWLFMKQATSLVETHLNVYMSKTLRLQ